jgi:hypothetical protein
MELIEFSDPRIIQIEAGLSPLTLSELHKFFLSDVRAIDKTLHWLYRTRASRLRTVNAPLGKRPDPMHRGVFVRGFYFLP